MLEKSEGQWAQVGASCRGENQTETLPPAQFMPLEWSLGVGIIRIQIVSLGAQRTVVWEYLNAVIFSA
jgi:hypothetical protein